MDGGSNTEPGVVNAFIDYFRDEKEADFRRLFGDHDDGPYYNDRNCSIFIDWKKFHDANTRVANIFNDAPDTFLANAKEAFVEYATEVIEDEGGNTDAYDLEAGYVRVRNTEEREIRNLRASDLNQPVTLRGVVSKRTDVKPKLTQAKFRCDWCFEEQNDSIAQSRGPLREPNECDNETCNSSSFNVIYDHDETEFLDTQAIQMQERPEGLKGGERPQEINVRIEGDICGEVNAGDRVQLTGVLRAEEQHGQDSKTTHEIYVKGSAFTHEETDLEEIELTEQDEQKVEELVASFDDKLGAVRDSIAPSIHGYEDQKEALALQLFGGVPKDLPDGSSVRGDIHILLIGDPGTGKSQILQYVNEIAPRSVYSSGKGSSSAGLTAAAVRDDFGDGNEWTLEAGALVLADKGLAAIDELDKMDSNDRSAMHQALEQQEISVAKAGINATLKSRCSLLAAANPKYGRFDPYEPVPDQINLEPALISRFDLIFTITDDPKEEKDRELASHILNSNRVGQVTARLDEGEELAEEYEERAEEVEPVIGPDMLRKYVAYARKKVNPELTDEAEEKIEDFYVDLRNEDDDKDDSDESPVSITARQLEAAVRLAEAHARVRLSDTITLHDAEKALEIIQKTLEDVGYDPDTGELDADRFVAGTSTSERNQIRNVQEAVSKLEEEMDDDEGVPLEDIAELLGKDEDTVRQQLKKLKPNGDVYRKTDGGWKTP